VRTKTDLKAGYANSRLELPIIAIERLGLPEAIGRIENHDDRPVFKTGHAVAAILE
jgi:hypothetical protein